MVNRIRVSGKNVRELALTFHDSALLRIAADIQSQGDADSGMEFLGYLIGFQIQHLSKMIGHQKVKEIIDEHLLLIKSTETEVRQ